MLIISNIRYVWYVCYFYLHDTHFKIFNSHKIHLRTSFESDTCIVPEMCESFPGSYFDAPGNTADP